MIYLDNNATTTLNNDVKEAMISIMGLPLNASATYSSGRQAKKLLQEAKDQVKALVNAREDDKVIFTASGTESNNLALQGLDKNSRFVSNIEHSSILKIGVQDGIITVDNAGIIDLGGLERLLKISTGKKKLVSIMLANNETGIIQPIKEIADIVHKYGALIHTDAAQCCGKIPVDIQDLDVDMMSISSHKFGGPQGAAALIVRKDVPLKPLVRGASQEHGLRAGTENIVAIHGFGVAAKIAAENLQLKDKIESMRNNLEEKIKNISPDSVFFGKEMIRLPNTSMFTMPDIPSQTQLMHFDLDNIALSAGAACMSGQVETSHVLLAMNVNPQIAKCAIRVSIGIDNSEDDIQNFIESWERLFNRTRAKDAA